MLYNQCEFNTKLFAYYVLHYCEYPFNSKGFYMNKYDTKKRQNVLNSDTAKIYIVGGNGRGHRIKFNYNLLLYRIKLNFCNLISRFSQL